MLPASNCGLGMNFGFPDVCLTPPAAEPIPYPNMAMHEMAVPFAPNVLVSCMPGINMEAETPITLGDETGDLSPFMGPGRFWMGNPTVLINALPAISLLCPTSGNDMIDPIGAVVVPAITNVFYSRTGASPGEVDGPALQALSRTLSAPGTAEDALLPGGIAYVRVPIFSSAVPARVYSALQRFGAGAAGLIVDLRGCPGGELIAAVELASDFLPPGAVIGAVVDGDGDETLYRARGGGASIPLVLLVDHLTASAAEVFAGALQAHGRAVVVGERTYGKGSAQELLPGLAGPGVRYATVATFTLPGGEPLAGRGIHPDVAVAPGDALDAARAALASLLSLHEVR
jgi:carboxyl-terminal processing protease